MRKVLLLLPFFLWTCSGGSTEPEPPQLPTVTNIEITTLEDTAKTFAFSGTDPSNLVLSYSISTQPQYGSISINAGVGTYTPNANYNGSDVFYYIASSSNGNSNIGTVVVTITPVDDEPSTMDVSVTTDEDNAITMTLEADEFDGDNIQFNVTGNPSNGSVTISGSTATYTPAQDWFGTDTFNFEAVDISSKSILNNAIATIIVNPINDKPTVMDISDIEVSINSSIEITLLGSDVDGDNLTYSIVDNPTNGSVTIDGAVATFTSSSSGEHSFTYKANDGILDSEPGTVSINMNWEYSTFGDSNEEFGIALRQTSDGGYILGGTGGNSVMYLVKVSASGNEEWSKYYGSGGFISSVLQLSDDSFIFYGSGPNDEMKLTKVSNNGSVEWEKIFVVNGQNVKAPYQGQDSLQQTSDGGYIFVGRVGNAGNYDGYIIKTDQNGNKEWSKIDEGLSSGDDMFYSVKQTQDGGFIFAGFTTFTGHDMYLVKTDSNGTTLWSERYYWNSNGGGGDSAWTVDLTSDGGYLLTGTGDGSHGFIVKTHSDGIVEFERKLTSRYTVSGVQTSDGGYIFTGNSNADVFVLKIDSSGNDDWLRTYGGQAYDGGNSIRQKSDGGYIILGSTISYGTSGSNDMFLLNLDSNGDRIY
tara:strand:- start:203 stop:2128 length:1926 start_codon:yes stop_codon:yes gene_type:complete